MQPEVPLNNPAAGLDMISPGLAPVDWINHGFIATVSGSCVASGCHPSQDVAQADKTALQTEVQNRLNGILARLGPVTTWGYSAEGGPPANQQAQIPIPIQQVRFLYEYVNVDGSLGVHNPPYARAILTEAETLLTAAGK
jgi:hypothetical protein